MARKSARAQHTPVAEPAGFRGAGGDGNEPPPNGVASHAAPREIGEHEIRALAHQIYERRTRDGMPGDERSDWVEAERTLRDGSPSR